ncbi:hypothetical protein DFP72DRAFT_814161, partial [Ephemerocybe angulata]
MRPRSPPLIPGYPFPHYDAEVQQKQPTVTMEDWEDLKEMWTRCLEVVDVEEPEDVLPLLRGIIHECTRFLQEYDDPSVVFMAPPKSNHETTESVQFLEDSLFDAHECCYRTSISVKSEHHHLCHNHESNWHRNGPNPDLPTAFHSLLGTALFLFGNLIGANPELALEGEPQSSTVYHLYAVDVFEVGENLPAKTLIKAELHHAPSSYEDWQMAVTWGRALVNLAEDLMERQNIGPLGSAIPGDGTHATNTPVATPNGCDPRRVWAEECPFVVIRSRIPPVTRRMNLGVGGGVSVDEMMTMAVDQFSRGIFHMPRSGRRDEGRRNHSVAAGGGAAPASAAPFFSRASHLYTIAVQVLLLAEKLGEPESRYKWARYADTVFGQMKLEENPGAATNPEILKARGRCALIIGGARVEEGVEGPLEQVYAEAGEDGAEQDGAGVKARVREVLESEDAVEARERLEDAVKLLERAREV